MHHKYQRRRFRRRGKRTTARLLALARTLAARRGRRGPDGFVTVDDVSDGLVRCGHEPGVLGSTAGVVFRTPGWRGTRFRARSRIPQRRGRELKIWQLVARPPAALPRRGETPTKRLGYVSVCVDDYRRRRLPGGSPELEALVSCARCGEPFPESCGHVRGRESFCAECKELEEASEDES